MSGLSDLDRELHEARDALFAEYGATTLPPRPGTTSPPRPGGDPVPVPPPTGGDGVVHPVPDPVHGDSVASSSSWSPGSLVALAADPPAPPEILGLLYPGRIHLLSGESEALKTWLVLAAAVDEMREGRAVLWIDGDDVGAGALLERLVALGAQVETVDRLFGYVCPDGPIDDAGLMDTVAFMRTGQARLAVFDGFNPLMTVFGFDPNAGVDVERFYRRFDPIRSLGVATVFTDNVIKDAEKRGGWSIGSERKRSKADVQIGMKAIDVLTRTSGRGRSRLDVHKDRPGWLTRPTAGVFTLEAEGDRLNWRIGGEETRTDNGEFRPTGLMERVSRFLESHAEPQVVGQIVAAKLGRAEYVRIAVDRLIEEGFATETPGPRGARIVSSNHAFRDDEGAA